MTERLDLKSEDPYNEYLMHKAELDRWAFLERQILERKRFRKLELLIAKYHDAIMEHAQYS